MSVHLDVPFYDNPDESSCVQAVFKMVLKYFTDKEYSWDELEKLTHKEQGKGTWFFPAQLELQDMGFQVVSIEEFDYERYFTEGTTYLYELYDNETAEWYLTNSNLEDVKHLIPQYLKESKVVVRRAEVSDIENFLQQGFLVACDVNSGKLHDEDAYTSHLVLVVGFDDASLIVHDPIGGDLANQYIPKERFQEAWNDSRPNLTAFYYEKNENYFK